LELDMNRLRTISWASSLFAAAVVGCQLVGCSDDTSTTPPSEDAAVDGAADSSTPLDGAMDAAVDSAKQDAGMDAAADAAGDVAADAAADVANDVMPDALMDAHADGGDAASDAHGDTGSDAMGDVVTDAMGDHQVSDAEMDAGDAMMMDAGDAMMEDVTVGSDGGGDSAVDGTVGDVTTADVASMDVNAADVDAGPTVQALCDAFLAANADGGLGFVSNTCTGTELALFMRDVNSEDAGITPGTCLLAAFNSGALDDTIGDGTLNECEDQTWTAGSGSTAAECVAEVQCGIGVNSGCNGSSSVSECTRNETTYLAQAYAIKNLYCGADNNATCEALSPATSAPGTCVTQWLAGVPASDSDPNTSTGELAETDGLKPGYASGYANGVILTNLQKNPTAKAACLN
jgi:hypothetical protein